MEYYSKYIKYKHKYLNLKMELSKNTIDALTLKSINNNNIIKGGNINEDVLLPEDHEGGDVIINTPTYKPLFITELSDNDSKVKSNSESPSTSEIFTSFIKTK